MEPVRIWWTEVACQLQLFVRVQLGGHNRVAELLFLGIEAAVASAHVAGAVRGDGYAAPSPHAAACRKKGARFIGAEVERIKCVLNATASLRARGINCPLEEVQRLRL